jgi:hypothetical protein
MPLVDAHDFVNPRGRPLRKLLSERVVRHACLRQVILDGVKNGAVRLSHDAPGLDWRATA